MLYFLIHVLLGHILFALLYWVTFLN